MKVFSKKKVFVGVSGGVDSSVSAALLKDQGYEVVGVFIRTWQPDWIECTWRDERRDAMRVCAHLDIPFVELDLEQEYKQGVADYMIREYKLGRTPNPDVMCNREVKFGGFLKWALAHGADLIATGHYVDRRITNKGSIEMLRGNDPQKDQSYFLWTLDQDQLKYILFPVGNIPKSQVRTLAQKYKLPTAVKKDSQGICFIGEIDMKEFLGHYILEEPGEVVNQSGEIIGSHRGVLFYTLGERHGFHIDKKGTQDTPYYVMHKDIENNRLVVAHDLSSVKVSNEYELVDVVDNQNLLLNGYELEAQIRYRGDIKKVTITDVKKETHSLWVRFENPDSTITQGQSVVFYQGNVCLGGGIIN